MGLTKPNNYDQFEMYFSCIARALSHPARRRILLLIQEGELVTQHSLIHLLKLNQTSINRHVNSLKQANLLIRDYHVHFETLRLNEETLEAFENHLRHLRTLDK